MVLRDLMRHASVETTEKYYVGVNAKKTLEHLRNRKRSSEVNGRGDVSSVLSKTLWIYRATGEIRTHDLSFTKAVVLLK